MYKQVVRFAREYKICNLLEDKPAGAQIIITTLGKFKNFATARDKLDLSELKVVIFYKAN